MTTKVYGEIYIQNYKDGQYMEVRLAFLLKKTIQIEIDDYGIGTMFRHGWGGFKVVSASSEYSIISHGLRH